MLANLPIENFPAQEQIFSSPSRFKIVAKGRRFGLTRGAANNFIRGALEDKFKKGLWVDTVNGNIDRYVERYFVASLKHLPKSLFHWRKQAKILEIKGAYIDFRSADKPENIEGFGYDEVFLNEAGIILSDEYLWDHAIRPMLWEYAPKTVIGGTPKGKNIFYQLALKGQDKDQTDYEFFHYTSFDNPFLDTAALEDDMKNMPKRVVQQEIYAEFLEETGVVFRGVRSVSHARPRKPQQGHMYVVGADIAKLQDWTVLAVYDRTTNSQVYQERFQKFEWSFQKEKIRSLAKHYNNAVVALDATGIGDPISDDLLRSGVPVEPIKLTYQSKKEIIEKLSVYIERGHIRIINHPETLAEFDAYTYDITKAGRLTYGAPQGYHDDIVVSHALAVSQLLPIVREDPEALLTPVQETYQKLAGRTKEYEFDFNTESNQAY